MPDARASQSSRAAPPGFSAPAPMGCRSRLFPVLRRLPRRRPAAPSTSRIRSVSFRRDYITAAPPALRACYSDPLSMLSRRKGRIHAVAAISLFAAAHGMLSAQWPPHPTPGVSRASDGQPNLKAPAPRGADGHPDFSGIWRFTDSPDARPGPPPPAGVGTIGIGLRAPGLNQFFDIGSTLPNGLPFQPWAAELRKRRVADNNKDNPDAHCLPLGLMQLHTHPEPRK